jgi:hypothetical protein
VKTKDDTQLVIGNHATVKQKDGFEFLVEATFADKHPRIPSFRVPF